MPFPKGDPRAKAAGRKGQAVRRANREAERNTTRPASQPDALPLTPSPPRPTTPAEQLATIARNTELLEQITETFTDKAALGLLIQFALTSNAKTGERIRALQVFLRYALPEPGDPAEIAKAILEAEGIEGIDISALEVYDDSITPEPDDDA